MIYDLRLMIAQTARPNLRDRAKLRRAARQPRVST